MTHSHTHAMPLSETFRVLRTQIEASPEILASPKLNCYNHVPVFSRTCNTFLSETPVTSCHYNRRRQQAGTGLFTPKQQPYKPFGNFNESDVYGWIANYFQLSIPNQCLGYQPLNGQLHTCSSNSKIDDTKASSHTIQIPKLTEHREVIPSSLYGGMSSIKVELEATDQTVREMEGGACFLECMKMEQARKKFLKEMHMPKKLKQCGCMKDIHVHNPSIFLSTVIPKASSKACLSLLQAAILMSEEGNTTINMEAMHSAAKPGVGPSLSIAHKAYISGDEDSEQRSVDEMQNCVVKFKLVHTILCCLHNLKSRDLRSKDPLSTSLLKKLSQKPVFPNFHDHSTKVYSSRPIRTPLLYKDTKSKSTESHDKNARKDDMFTNQDPISSSRLVPPWQCTVVFVDKEAEERLKHPERRVISCLEALEHTRNSLGNKVAKRLEQRVKMGPYQLLTKLQSIKFGYNSGKEINIMRKKAHELEIKEARSKFKKPEWFDVIELEINKVLKGKYKEEGQRLLKQLDAFTTVNYRALLHVLEKLCLIVMSMPAYQLCTVPGVKAVEFILEHILFISPTLCAKWIALRHLPLPVPLD